jgi:hypothetical protein
MSQNITNGITKCAEGSNNEERYQLFPGCLPYPPADGRCNCCGKHISDLRPFSVFGNTSGMDIKEVLLVKNVRPQIASIEEIDRILEEVFEGCRSDEDYKKAEEMLVVVFGKEDAEDLLLYANASVLVTISWECRECIALDTEVYFAMRTPRYSRDPGNFIPISRDGMVRLREVLTINNLRRRG